NAYHFRIARHGLQHEPVVFNIIGTRVFAKEFSLFFQLGAVTSEKGSPRIAQMLDADLLGFNKSFDETSSYPRMAFQYGIFHNHDVANRKNLRAQVILFFDFAKIWPQAAHSRNMTCVLRS